MFQKLISEETLNFDCGLNNRSVFDREQRSNRSLKNYLVCCCYSCSLGSAYVEIVVKFALDVAIG